MKLKKRNLSLLSIFLAFGFIYGLISLTNHYLFRTSALDLGIFNHAVYNYAHFKIPYFTLGLTAQETGIIECFGNHFSPFIFLLAPFYFIFGSYTLLIIQILSILTGGFGIYRYTTLRINGSLLPQLIIIHFFSIWGIYSALAFDFHLNVIAAMLVPWLFYYHQLGRLKSMVVVLLLIILTRENMSVWMAFIFAAIWMDRNLRSKQIHPITYPIIIVSCIIYFILVIQVLMPKFVPYESLGQLAHYSNWGGSIPEIVKGFVLHPSRLYEGLFTNTIDDATFNGIKLEFHLMALMAGGLFLIIRPAFIIMLVPIYLQKLFSNNYGMWGINNHYSIELVPILSILLVEVIIKIKSFKLQTALAVGVLLTTIYSTYSKMENRKSVWYSKEQYCFFIPEHYKTQFDIRTINKKLQLLNNDASVSCHFSLAPHLAYRSTIYQFPVTADANYIVLLKTTSNFYPLNEEEYFQRIDEYRNSNEYTILDESKDLIIFQRKL